MQLRRSTGIATDLALVFFVFVFAAVLAEPQVQSFAETDHDPTTPALASETDRTSEAVVVPGHLYDRIAVIGASVSDGFGVVVQNQTAHTDASATPPEERRMNLSDVLCSASSVTPAPIVHHYASELFFANPGLVGKSEIDRALAIKPTLVLALDYLFWYLYGTVTVAGEPMQSEAERLANFEVGLAQLDRVLTTHVPIVIADIPNMSDAIGKMLYESQVPSGSTIAKANARLTEWVRTRPAVKMMALTTVLAALKSGGVIEIAGRTWIPADCGPLIQKDQLHPTFAGTVVLAAGLIDLVRASDSSMPPPFAFEIDAIRTRALAGEPLSKPK
ncbi:MAG: hypothetical protein EXS15_06230 [Phycisphaerales bacterium]|nr:hypothetical protein [Phycisphaerales bacterium]